MNHHKTELIEHFHKRYNKRIKPVVRKSSKYNVPENTICPRCGATHEYIYDNNGGKGQFQCAVCSHTFTSDEPKMVTIKCPHCGHTLSVIKERSIFRIHKCINKKCPYYLSRKKELPKELSEEEKYLCKLHYIYREFTVNFFAMNLHSLPKRATSFNFKKFNPHILGLVLTYHVNCRMSTRQVAQAMWDIHNVKIYY